MLVDVLCIGHLFQNNSVLNWCHLYHFLWALISHNITWAIIVYAAHQLMLKYDENRFYNTKQIFQEDPLYT